jgi:superfamily II DNA or RNA helicase
VRVKGWTADGREVELTEHQEEAVRALLRWECGHKVMLAGWGRGCGKTTVMATVARYCEARARGDRLPGDSECAGLC